MKRIAVIALMFSVVCLGSASACEPQNCAPADSLFGALFDIVTAPCDLVAACLGVERNRTAYANNCCVVCVPETCRVVYAKPQKYRRPPCDCRPALGYPVTAPGTPYVVVPCVPAKPVRRADVSPPDEQRRVPDQPPLPKTSETKEVVSKRPPTEQPKMPLVPEVKPVVPAPQLKQGAAVPAKEPLPELTEPAPQPPDDVVKHKEPRTSPAPKPEVVDTTPPIAEPVPLPKAPAKPEAKKVEPVREVPAAAVDVEPPVRPLTLPKPETPPAVVTPQAEVPEKPTTKAPEITTTERKPGRDVHMAPPATDKRQVVPKKKEVTKPKKPVKKWPASPCSPPYMPRCY